MASTVSTSLKSVLQVSSVTASNSFKVSFRATSSKDLISSPLSWSIRSSGLERAITTPVANVVLNLHELAEDIPGESRASTTSLNRETNSASNGARRPNGWASQKQVSFDWNEVGIEGNKNSLLILFVVLVRYLAEGAAEEVEEFSDPITPEVVSSYISTSLDVFPLNSTKMFISTAIVFVLVSIAPMATTFAFLTRRKKGSQNSFWLSWL